MLKTKNVSFVAEVYHIFDKDRYGESSFMCTILKGEINKDDVVQFLDADGNFIVEQPINMISYAQKSFEKVKKSVPKDDKITLNFKHIWEYPINHTRYIVKMDESVLLKYKQKPKAILPVNNHLPYDQLITKTIDIAEFIKVFYVYPLSGALGYYFEDIDRKMGIECLRETELGALYSVHRVHQGGLLYIFYVRLDHSSRVKVSGWYYVKEKLSVNNFSSIQKGSTLTDLIVIDSAAQIYQSIYNSNEFLFNQKTVGLDTYHFLTDGVIKYHFVYTKTADKGGYLCVSKKEFADFDNIRLIQSGERLCSVNGRILPIDMID